MKEPRGDHVREEWTLDDGTQLLLRHIEPGDFPILRAFVDSLSFGTRYFRYGRGDVSFSDCRLREVCTPDPAACVHYLVVNGQGDAQSVVGSARILFKAGESTCELGITVREGWQSRGIGRQLIKALLESCRKKSLLQVRAHILVTNHRMIGFMRHCGFDIADGQEGPGIKVATIAVA